MRGVWSWTMSNISGGQFDGQRYGNAGERARGGWAKGEKGNTPAPLGRLFDQDPPYAIEAEMSLLGSMILDPRVIGDALQVLKGAEAFYDERHGLVYQSLISTFDKHHAVDLVQLRQALADKGVLEQVGGVEYLVQLAESVPTSANWPHFARLVSEKHRLRRLIDAAGQILFDAYHAGRTRDEDAGAIIDSAEQRIFEIAEQESGGDPQDLHQLLMLEYERLMALEEGKAAPDGVRCGYYDLDEMLGGFQPGEMIILAARPSMGKTALALNLAEQMALGTCEPASPRQERDPQPVGVFSLEMSKASLVQRMLSAWSGYSSQRIRRGALSTHDYEQLLTACGELGKAPLYIDDTPGLTVLQLRARARRMVHRYGVKALMIDYLQLLSSPGAARESRQVEVGAISRGVKALARELKVPIVCLSQLNRGPESRDNNRPRLSDLRESGSLEQDADVVLLLHREEYYHIGETDWLDDPNNADKVGVAEVIIAKQRNGPTGTVRLTWDSQTTRFKNHADARPSGDTYRAPRESGGGGGGGSVPRASLSDGPAVDVPKRGGGGGGGGWHAGKQSGPAEQHRDGGGPERDMGDMGGDEEAPPAPF
jgi:replicative DNA helicase